MRVGKQLSVLKDVKWLVTQMPSYCKVGISTIECQVDVDKRLKKGATKRAFARPL
jgi:uncharacterized protein YjhX (UPF0386 family)